MGRNQDYLPEAERFMPASKEEALLVYGDDDPLVYQEATGSLPGTWERIEVYRQRAAARQPIFNPLDRNDLNGGDLMTRQNRKQIDPIRKILREMRNRR